MIDAVTPYRRWAKVVVSIACTGAAIAALSCHPTSSLGKGQMASLGTAIDSAAMPEQGGADVQVRQMALIPDPVEAGTPPGRLPGGQSIEHFATQPDSFFRFTRTRGWVGWNRARACSSRDSRCKYQPSLLTRLTVQAMDGAQDVGFDSVQTMDLLVGRLYNTGTALDTLYPECPVTRPYYTECYVVISSNGGRPAQKLAIVRTSSSNAHTLSVMPFTPGLHSCRHDTQKRSAPEADFLGCADSTEARNGRGGKQSAVKMPPRPYSFATVRAWMSCAEGCCSSGKSSSSQ